MHFSQPRITCATLGTLLLLSPALTLAHAQNRPRSHSDALSAASSSSGLQQRDLLGSLLPDVAPLKPDTPTPSQSQKQAPAPAPIPASIPAPAPAPAPATAAVPSAGGSSRGNGAVIPGLVDQILAPNSEGGSGSSENSRNGKAGGDDSLKDRPEAATEANGGLKSGGTSGKKPSDTLPSSLATSNGSGGSSSGSKGIGDSQAPSSSSDSTSRDSSGHLFSNGSGDGSNPGGNTSTSSDSNSVSDTDATNSKKSSTTIAPGLIVMIVVVLLTIVVAVLFSCYKIRQTNNRRKKRESWDEDILKNHIGGGAGYPNPRTSMGDVSSMKSNTAAAVLMGPGRGGSIHNGYAPMTGVVGGPPPPPILAGNEYARRGSLGGVSVSTRAESPFMGYRPIATTPSVSAMVPAGNFGHATGEPWRKNVDIYHRE
ncbi:hypothetical protein EDD11_009285 [Mortierella claussenii]|nr:hypothetical protein EDD11_009285 [Mortierella claussenii]